MSLEPWQWWALGGVLVLVETLAPGVAFLWLGLAAFTTGLLLWLAPNLIWQAQVLFFALTGRAPDGSVADETQQPNTSTDNDMIGARA